ncbi:hypothetical protein C8Q80DRAFT_1148603 [Daedaleopsis nitida]|nr:hypothetical protein C8Q80DRAFT_1148603 [Daedaleopsis nitida]
MVLVHDAHSLLAPLFCCFLVLPSPASQTMSQFPWSSLKLDTIQAVLSDLGLEPYTQKSSVTQIVKVLRDIETDGRQFPSLRRRPHDP